MKFKAYIAHRDNDERHQLLRTRQQFLIRSQSQGLFKGGKFESGSVGDGIQGTGPSQFTVRESRTGHEKRRVMK